MTNSAQRGGHAPRTIEEWVTYLIGRVTQTGRPASEIIDEERPMFDLASEEMHFVLRAGWIARVNKELDRQ